MNNFFAMFVRSDRAPDLSDPVMMTMFGGSILAYSALSLACMVTITAKRDGGDGSDDDEGEDNARVSSPIGFQPAILGIFMGVSLFSFQWFFK